MEGASSQNAMTVLQEFLVKRGAAPEYAIVTESGPAHRPRFVCRALALGHRADACAGNKRDAKHEAARALLARLREAGLPVPPARDAPAPAPEPEGRAVSLLRELCDTYRLPAPEWTLVSDTGPPHARRFEVRCAVGGHARLAAATGKRAARQASAAALYGHLRERLAHLTGDFREEAALARALDRLLQRAEPDEWRPDLSQRVSEYHLALGAAAGAAEARAALAAGGWTAAAAALGAGVRREAVAAQAGPLELAALERVSPALVFGGRAGADEAAARHMRTLLA